MRLNVNYTDLLCGYLKLQINIALVALNHFILIIIVLTLEAVRKAVD